MAKKKEKSEELVLFPEAEVAGIKVKPWSFGKLFDFSEILETVLDKVEEKKMNIDHLVTSDLVTIIDIAKLFSIARKEVIAIIALTVEKPEEEIRSLSMEDGVKLAYVIFLQNKETIKNAFTPLLMVLKEEKEEEEEQEENNQE